MAVTKKKLPPLEASRAEQDAYARVSHGLQSTGTNMGAATRNRMTAPETRPPTPPAAPGAPPVSGATSPTAGSLPPSGPALVSVSVLDVGECKPGDQISFSVLKVQNGLVDLGGPIVLPGSPQGEIQ
jgi:hypothetical protein